MSTEFMELPNKKQWAIYYKQIKKPQCLENIFVRLLVRQMTRLTKFVLETNQTKGIPYCRSFRGRCRTSFFECHGFQPGPHPHLGGRIGPSRMSSENFLPSILSNLP